MPRVANKMKRMFGKVNSSSVWACECNAGFFAGSNSLPIAGGQVAFLLILSGEVRAEYPGAAIRIPREQAGIVASGGDAVSIRGASDTEVLVVGMSLEILGGMLESFRPGVREEIREIFTSPKNEFCSAIPLPEAVMSRTIPAFREPPVSGPALSFWFESQIRELIALVCFPPSSEVGEFFCSRQKRLALDRVAKAKTILKSRLDEAIDLQSLAAEIGCSPFYLSRTFSTCTGMTISRFVRKLRIEAAAELLLSGRFNVGEVAIEVGYQSLSHFSKAFQQVKGCLPSKYDAA